MVWPNCRCLAGHTLGPWTLDLPGFLLAMTIKWGRSLNLSSYYLHGVGLPFVVRRQIAGGIRHNRFMLTDLRLSAAALASRKNYNIIKLPHE